MSWIEKIEKMLPSGIASQRKHNIPEGVWSHCTDCGQIIYSVELERNLHVCPKCDHHMRISARSRLLAFLD